jgi:hypothetical protein
VLRFVRIALLISVSFVAGATIVGCSDDTTNVNAIDMTASVGDLSPAKSTDMASHD